MQQSNQEKTYPSQTDVIDLRKFVNSLRKRKWFIFVFNGIVVLLTIVYVLSLPPPPYIVESSFTKPSNTSVLKLNSVLQQCCIELPFDNHFNEEEEFIKETRETVHAAFLNKLNNKIFQKNIFMAGDYVTKIKKENLKIDDIDSYSDRFLNKIEINLGGLKLEELNTHDKIQLKYYSDSVSLFEKPSKISIEWLGNAEAMSEFLNELVAKADIDTVSDYISLIKQKIDIRLDQISLERRMLLATEKQKRLKDIETMAHGAEIANSMEMTDHNFNRIFDDSNLIIAIGELEAQRMTKKLPDWYLFGEKALLERIKLLKKRTNDVPFIPQIIALDIEKLKLESYKLESSGINAMQLDEAATSHRFSNMKKKRQIIVGFLFSGFILSIFLTLLINVFKEDEIEPTTTN